MVKSTPVICNEEGCGKCVYKSVGGVVKYKCQDHHNEAGRISKRKQRKKKLESEDSETYVATTRHNANLRMKKSRDARKLMLDGIEDANVKRLATAFDSLKTNRKWVLVNNVLPDTFSNSNIKLKGRAMPINFGKTKVASTRTMQEVKNPEDILTDIMSALQHVFPECVHVAIKLLKSRAGDLSQSTHLDHQNHLPLPSKLSEFHYSAIISIEDSTSILVGKTDNQVSYDIPKYSMFLFRGDLPHAGAGYPSGNSRLFISISSDKFKVTDDVFIVN